MSGSDTPTHVPACGSGPSPRNRSGCGFRIVDGELVSLDATGDDVDPLLDQRLDVCPNHAARLLLGQ
jgi:hypothetical protein